jgi:hypothetical protein
MSERLPVCAADALDLYFLEEFGEIEAIELQPFGYEPQLDVLLAGLVVAGNDGPDFGLTELLLLVGYAGHKL